MRFTGLSSDFLKRLVRIYEQVCEEFALTSDEQRNGVDRTLIDAATKGVTDPELLRAAAIDWLRKNPTVEGIIGLMR